MRVIIFFLLSALSLTTYAAEVPNLFDPDSTLGALTVRYLPYKLKACRTGLGSANARLGWYFDKDGKIDEVYFEGLDSNMGAGEVFFAMFPILENYRGLRSTTTASGVKFDTYESNIIRNSKELIFQSGISNIQYKQIYYESPSSTLDCTYELESKP